jgi:hypothetical protein
MEFLQDTEEEVEVFQAPDPRIRHQSSLRWDRIGGVSIYGQRPGVEAAS